MIDNDKPAFGFDDPNRGPLDRAADAVTGESGGTTAAMDRSTDEQQQTGSTGVVSAIF